MQKNLLIGFSIVICNNILAQKKETFYDFYWKPCPSAEARFYGTVEKTDSGWFRQDYFVSPLQLQMQVLYEDEACKIANGRVYYFYANGRLSIIGKMIHGKREDVCLSFYSNGMMKDSATYHNDRPIGNKISWHKNGYMSDSIAHVNDSTDVHFGWFDDGSNAFAGYLLNGKKHGKWKYFHRNGEAASYVLYEKGTPIEKQYFNEDGSALIDTSQVNREATFAKGGLNGWKKYLEKKLVWPVGFKFNNGTEATVGIDFVVNEEGKIEDVEVSVPLHPEFDKIAVNVIKNSPLWLPAVLQNRKVKSWHTQPITFAQQE